MFSDDETEFAAQLHDKAVAIIKNQNLPLTPVNYSVIYIHVSNRQKALTKAIKAYLATHRSLENKFLQEMFEKYLLEKDRFKNELIMPFDSVIDNMLSQISNQIQSEKQMVSDIKALGRHLSNIEKKSEVKQVVSDLGGLADKAKTEHVSLCHKMENARDEITTLKEKLASSEKEANTDPLTGLLNRRGLYKELANIESPEKIACLVIDIDHFKKINDSYGHLIGDRILKRVTKEIQQNIRGRDLAVRFGGEEFIILLPDTPLEGAQRVAETLRKKIDSLQLVMRSSQTTLPTISVSLGVAVNDPFTEWDLLFSKADEALYAAKAGGRNQTRVALGDEFVNVSQRLQ